MKTFNYKARPLIGGQTVEGVAEANTKDEAIRTLRDAGMFVESIEEATGTRDIDLQFGTKRAKEKALAVVCSQFSILLRSGLPIVRTLELISNQTEDKTLKEVLKNAADDVAAGYSLADSLEKNGSGLPTTFIESVRAGEESGQMEVVFDRLNRYYDKQSKTKSKVRSAMMYPTFVMGIAVLVVIAIMVFAVPVFSNTFASMGAEMPAITQFVIDSSAFWTHYWWLVAILVIAVVVGIKVAKKNERFNLWWSSLGLRVPVIGRINHMSGASQYAGTMGVMMSAGLSMVKAVDVTGRSMTNAYMGNSLLTTMPDLESGRPLSECLKREGTLPELAVEMTAVGEQTGALEETMTVLSEYYDNEVETATERALGVMEPVIIVCLALIVFVLLLAVYLPLFSMYGGIGG